jgi:uncharacterized integral membrane protein
MLASCWRHVGFVFLLLGQHVALMDLHKYCACVKKILQIVAFFGWLFGYCSEVLATFLPAPYRLQQLPPIPLK